MNIGETQQIRVGFFEKIKQGIFTAMKSNRSQPTEMQKLLALNFSRPLRLEKHPLDLVQLIKQIVADSKEDALTFFQTVLTEELPSQPVMINADLRSFKGCLLKLLANSIQAIPKGKEGKIKFTLHQENQLAIVKVIDTGKGIPKENLEKIFELYFTTKPAGNGFGLAEVKREILAHDGTVEVESIVGQGTTFTLKIPTIT